MGVLDSLSVMKYAALHRCIIFSKQGPVGIDGVPGGKGVSGHVGPPGYTGEPGDEGIKGEKV